MPHGAPDFANVGPIETIHRLFDMGELAARLKSLVRYHRGGTFVQEDDFSAGYGNWAGGGSGTGNARTLRSDIHRSGGASVLLTCGSTLSLTSWLMRSFGYPVAGDIGVEVSFAGDSDDVKLELKVRWYGGRRLYRFGIRYDFNAETLDYLKYDNTWVAWQTDVKLDNEVGVFHTVKLVLDLDTFSYVRVILNEVSYALAVTQSGVSWIGDPEVLNVEILARGDSGVNKKLYVDDFILTENEP